MGHLGLKGSAFYPFNKYWSASNMPGMVSLEYGSGEPR